LSYNLYNGSFTTIKPNPGDFDACWDPAEVDINYLRVNAPRLLSRFNMQAQKTMYKGEIFRSDEPVGDYGLDSFEFFQRDRLKNKKGIIAIDLIRWEP
jgi:hypothetical protein